jgi:excisionase family DNA binding protein
LALFVGSSKPIFGSVEMDLMLSAKEVASLFADPIWAAKFPPLLTVDQAAELLQVPKQTVYAWSSQGLLDSCKSRAGKHLRLLRDRLIQSLSEGKLHGDK